MKAKTPAGSSATLTALALCLCVSFIGAACSDEPAARSARPAPSTGAAADMCAEHGVLEAICTRCHPQLAAVFQAKGDWCSEHGFPESVCPICHPERGGRPAVKVEADDGAPADGLPVNLKDPSLAKASGIETVVVEERPNGPEISAVARIVYDASRVALVNARAPGVVRELRADIGARVEKGEVLAILESASIGAERGRLQAARSQLQVAEAAARRKAELQTTGIVPAKEVELARQDVEAARAQLTAAEAALGMVGGGAGSTWALTSPLAGVVVRRSVGMGQNVDAGPILFEVVDASSMWAEIDVPEQHAAAVRRGSLVRIEVDALPGKTFEAKIDSVVPEIDPRTRTAHARASLENDEGLLRAHMFAKATIALGAERPSLMVPRSAVQRARSVQVVFVEKAPGQYETRRVTTGIEEAHAVEITQGLAAGESVVTTGSFLLKTETLKDGIGAGCCD